MLQKEKQELYEIFNLKQILNFFLPWLTKNYYLNFYGGEPLLCFPLIKKAVSFLNCKNKEVNKKSYYSITTNGSLITEEIIQFFNKNRFSVELSFDGLAQNLARDKGSFGKIVSLIKELLKYPNINLEINSVFSSETISYLSESIRFIMDLNVSDIHFSLSIIKPWDKSSLFELEKEMAKLRKIILSHYKRKGDIPVINFREEKKKGIFYCAAGKDRMAIMPGGEIWGCHLFPDYFKEKEKTSEYQKYYFGSLDNLTKNHKNIYPKICSNYSRLSMDNFSTSNNKCFLCSEIENCAVCPVNASFSGAPLGKIPDYVCEIKKLLIREKSIFQKELQKIFIDSLLLLRHLSFQNFIIKMP